MGGKPMRLKQDRIALAERLATAARMVGATVTISDDSEPVVNCRTATLGAMICCDKPHRDIECDVPMIHWHGAAHDLIGYLPGVWAPMDVNPYHRRKATSFPSTIADLETALTVGLIASLTGDAFIIDNNVDTD